MKSSHTIYLIYFISLIFISNTASAFKIPIDYKDGVTLCRELTKNKTNEIGKWVKVPIDYNSPQSPTTLIYSYTTSKFDPAKPSLIYFMGGPGSSSHGSEFSLPNTNVIFFEQRGIGCSRPKTQELFLDPSYYSSENTANDALLILNAYDINKAAIFGHSYGTVPATIFASIFPKRTQALLLEGVVFKADESLWISPRKIGYMQNFFDLLTENQRHRILSVSARPDIPKTWFSYMARMALSVGNFKDGLMGFLDSTVFATSENQEQADKEFAEAMTDMIPTADTTTPAEQGGLGEVTMGMIACQEMNMADPMMSHLLYFENERLIPDRNNIERTSMCEPLGLAHVEKPQYSAERYPFDAPVTYFLGEHDSATSLDQGLNHFNFSGSKNKQALILLKGGHAPNLELLLESSYCDAKNRNCKQHQIEVNIFEKAARGEKISSSELQEFNSSGDLQWTDSLQLN